MSCETTDDDLKITDEYKYLLSYIRPLIDQLQKSKDAQLCLLWLSKLEQCSAQEKSYRNEILFELCMQVKSNCLKPPFDVAPPNGPLRNIIFGDWKARKWIHKENVEADASTTEEVLSTSSQPSVSSRKHLQNCQDFPVPWSEGYCCGNTKNKNTKNVKEVLDHSRCFAIQNAYHETAQSDQMVIERYQDIIKSLVTQQLKADISPSKLKKLQSTYQVKISELVHFLKRVQEENEILRRKIECMEGEMKKVHLLRKECENLQKNISELERKKNSLEEKCKQAEEEKLLSLSDLINKLSEAEKKAKESDKRLKSLERKYEDTCIEFETEYQNKSKEKEKFYLAEITTLEKLLKEKEIKIASLEKQLSNQSISFEKEISNLKRQLDENSIFCREKEKVKKVKNKAKKMSKIQEKMTILFQSQLQKILAQKDFYIASLEMQLKINNSESGGSLLSSDHQNSLDEKVASLEARYRKLLEEAEEQSIKRRQQDLQKIHALEKQLLSFGAIVVDNEFNLDQKQTESKIPNCISSSSFNADKDLMVN